MEFNGRPLDKRTKKKLDKTLIEISYDYRSLRYNERSFFLNGMSFRLRFTMNDPLKIKTYKDEIFR